METSILKYVFSIVSLEIIKLKLKKNKAYFLVLGLLLFTPSIIILYFSVSNHPEFLNIFWSDYGIPSTVWIWIWLFLDLLILWLIIINSKPSYELIRWYIDCLENEPEKFVSLFKRYEKYFFSKSEDASSFYADLLEKKEFWDMITKHCKEWLRRNPKRLHFKDNLKVLLSSQLSKLADSPIAKELEMQQNLDISDETPILSVFLQDKNSIEKSNNNDLMDVINYESNEYLLSNLFLKKEKENFILKPSKKASDEVAPKRLIIFYYIQLIDCYWSQVIQTKSNGFAWPAYEYWTKELLVQAPNLNSDNQSNYYILAIDKMLSNISDWVYKTKESSKQEHIQDFNDLKIVMLFEIQKNHLDKVSETWFINKTDSVLGEIITGKNLLQETYNESSIENKLLKLKYLKPAFENFSDREFPWSEKNNIYYQWLSRIIENSKCVLQKY